MTLLDLCRLIKRFWVIVIAFPVVFGVACAGYLLVQEETVSHSATAQIVVNSSPYVNSVAGVAAGEVRQFSAEPSDFTLAYKADGATMTVSVTVSGPDPDSCVEIVNSTADSIVEKSDELLVDTAQKDALLAFKAEVEYADAVDEVLDAGKQGSSKYVLVAILAGLFVAICVIVVIDMMRRPVKSIEGVQDAVELPVLEKLPVADGGERLLANVRFASKIDDLRSASVIPVGDAALAEEIAGILTGAAAAEGKGAALSVTPCKSLALSMDAAYLSRDVDAVVLAVRQWTDSLSALESSVAELRLADANLVGIVFAKEKK